MRQSTPRQLLKGCTAAAMAAGLVAARAQPAFAGGTNFTPGDFVVEEVVPVSPSISPSSTASTVQLVEYSPSTAAATPSGVSVSLASTPLVESGTASNDGEINLSTDGYSILVPGYDCQGPCPTTALTSAYPNAKIVDAVTNTSGGITVDSSTVLTDSRTEGTTAKENFRSANGSTTDFWTGSNAGLGAVADGGSTPTYLDANPIDDAVVFNNTLYESEGHNIVEVGTPPPTSGTPTETTLTFTGTGKPTSPSPDQFFFVTVGATTYLFDADQQSGTVGTIDEYTASSPSATSWTYAGSLAGVPGVDGLIGYYNSSVQQIELYATYESSSSGSYKNDLSSFSFSPSTANVSSATTNWTTVPPSGDSFQGLAWSPTAVEAPAQTPEVPWAGVLPLSGLAILGGGGWLARRRRRSVRPV